MMLLKRVRGLCTSMLLWSVPWAGFGLLVGLAYVVGLFPDDFFISGPSVPGGIPVALALAGALIGAVNGFVFGSIIMAAERHQGVSQLRASRIGAWAALATAATVGLFTSSLLLAVMSGAFGFGVGVAALRVAQRGAPVPTLGGAT